jgi:hypothetical protein
VAAQDFIGPEPTSIDEHRPDVANWIRNGGADRDDERLRVELLELFDVSDDELIEAFDLAADVRRARNGNGPAAAENPSALRVVPFADFIADRAEPIPPLAGEDGESVIPRAGLIVVGGVGGASKTTWTIDAVAHFASGTPWLTHPVATPLRVLLIENEGSRELYRRKLEEKATAWQGQTFEPNVFVLDDPGRWGGFTFADQACRQELRTVCVELAIDLVVANPVGRLGAIGGGTPEEVGTFVGWLRECGLWHDLAFWLIHHFNRGVHSDVLQRLSGAWDRDADTIIGLALDGTRRTKLTWAKLRYATPPEEKALLLEWHVASRGFSPIATEPKTVGDANRQRVLEQVRIGHRAASAIADTIGLTKKTVLEHFKALAHDGLVQLEDGPNRSLEAVATEAANVQTELANSGVKHDPESEPALHTQNEDWH